MKHFVKKNAPYLLILMLALCLLFVYGACAQRRSPPAESVQIGIAWRTDDDTAICKAIEEVGATPVQLDLVRSADVRYDEQRVLPEYLDENGLLATEYAEKIKQNTYRGSNVETIVGEIDAIVFPGGEDVMPTLYKQPEAWHGIAAEKDYSPARDISDYLLMSYCIERDIAVLGICRGMQMLSVVSGATINQDIPTYFETLGKPYNNEHRPVRVTEVMQNPAAHDVTVKQGTLLYRITGTETLHNVPSWHHQAVQSVAGTDLTVSGTTLTAGEEMIEAVELPGKKFVLGIQFHPEIALEKNLENEADKGEYLPYEDAVRFFAALKAAA